MIIYPEIIRKGDMFGTTATSNGASKESDIIKLENAFKNLKELGYDGVETDNVRKVEKIVSSDGQTRAKEFMELWQREDIKWIIATRGGEFLIEIIPFLKSDIIKNSKPKWVQGFSDTSLLLHYLTTNYNIATIHTENFNAFCMEKMDKALLRTIDILESGENSEQENFELYEEVSLRRENGNELNSYNLTEKVEYKHLYNRIEEKILGRMIGGCIDTISELMGTKFDNTINFCNQFKEGMLWYLENCELTLPSLYRTLFQMKQNGWFKNANGFIIGRTRSKEKVENLEYVDVLHKIFDDLNVPVIYDVDVGHVAPQWTIINGSYGEFYYNNGTGKIIQKMI